MKPAVLLPIASLLSILLLTLHITDDMVRGMSKAEPANIALVVLVILLYGTLVLAERRLGHVIMLVVGVFAALMPVMHIRGAHYPDIARSHGPAFSSFGRSGRWVDSEASQSSSRSRESGTYGGRDSGSQEHGCQAGMSGHPLCGSSVRNNKQLGTLRGMGRAI